MSGGGHIRIWQHAGGAQHLCALPAGGPRPGLPAQRHARRPLSSRAAHDRLDPGCVPCCVKCRHPACALGHSKSKNDAVRCIEMLSTLCSREAGSPPTTCDVVQGASSSLCMGQRRCHPWSQRRICRRSKRRSSRACETSLTSLRRCAPVGAAVVVSMVLSEFMEAEAGLGTARLLSSAAAGRVSAAAELDRETTG